MRNTVKLLLIFAIFSLIFFIYESQDVSAQGSCDCRWRNNDIVDDSKGESCQDIGTDNCWNGYRPFCRHTAKPLDVGLRCKPQDRCDCVRVWTCSGEGQTCNDNGDCCSGLGCGTLSRVCKPTPDEQCIPDDTKLEGTCGRCGDQRWFCGDDYQWHQGACINQGPCNPGDPDSKSCGNADCAGTRTRTCDSSCNWPSWSDCSTAGNSCGICNSGTCGRLGNTCQGDSYQCNPGQILGSCRNCGTEVQTCSADRCSSTGTECINQNTIGDGNCGCGETCATAPECAVSYQGNSCGTCGRGTYDSCGTCQGDYTTCGSQGWKNTGRTCGNLGTEQQYCDGCSWGGTQCVNEEVCGNGVCRGSENSNNCPQDCAFCGDGSCNNGETCSSCPSDCGDPRQGQSCGTCGNGVYDSCGNCNGDFSVCGSQGWKNTGNSCQNCGTEQRFCDGCSWGSTQCANQGECAPGTNICNGDILRSCSSSTCSYSDTNCNDQDGWYNKGNSYSCCQGESSCSNCQDQEFRDYTCGAGVCTYTVTNTQTTKNTCSDCNLQDGWAATGRTQWVDDTTCTQKEQREEEFRDYTCSGGSCAPIITQTRWQDSGRTENKPDGTTCDDQNSCTNQGSCSAGVCQQGTNICSGTSTSCGCSTCTNCDLTGTGGGRTGDGCMPDGSYVDYTCSGQSCTFTTIPNDNRCLQPCVNSGTCLGTSGFFCDGQYWRNASERETGPVKCSDQIDNDCDGHIDFGDSSCVKIIAARSPDTVIQGTSFNAVCVSTGEANCVGAQFGGQECNYIEWDVNPDKQIRRGDNSFLYSHRIARFQCHASTLGQQQFRCYLPNKEDGRCTVFASPGEGGSPPPSEGDDNSTVLPSDCTQRTQAECDLDGLCQFCSGPTCQSTPGKYSQVAGTCIDITATCNDYVCEASPVQCAAECDADSVTCPDTDCSSLDGCYLSDSQVSNSTCFGQTGCEYRDYANPANTCDTANTCTCSNNQCIEPTPQQPDNDLDGYDSLCDADCNDNNANIYPNAPDCCSTNQYDVNCDGQINPNCDKDNDGYIDENAQLCLWE